MAGGEGRDGRRPPPRGDVEARVPRDRADLGAGEAARGGQVAEHTTGTPNGAQRSTGITAENQARDRCPDGGREVRGAGVADHDDGGVVQQRRELASDVRPPASTTPGPAPVDDPCGQRRTPRDRR